MQMPTQTTASPVAGEAADARDAGRADAAWTSAVEITRLGRSILFMVGVFHAVCRGGFTGRTACRSISPSSQSILSLASQRPHRMSSLQQLLDRVTAGVAGRTRH